MKLSILGAPGSGKGTVAKGLAAQKHFLHISPGRLLRQEAAKQTARGNKIARIMEQGKLVDDHLAMEVTFQAIGTHQHYILDGFPRTITQAHLAHDAIDCVLFLEVELDQVVERLSGRRICSKCGQSYHIKFVPPPQDGRCACGGILVQRDDDKPATVKMRFETYQKETAPLIAFYEKKKILKRVDASKRPSEVINMAIATLEECE